jgi:hypothetical protein
MTRVMIIMEMFDEREPKTFYRHWHSFRLVFFFFAFVTNEVSVRARASREPPPPRTYESHFSLGRQTRNTRHDRRSSQSRMHTPCRKICRNVAAGRPAENGLPLHGTRVTVDDPHTSQGENRGFRRRYHWRRLHGRWETGSRAGGVLTGSTHHVR